MRKVKVANWAREICIAYVQCSWKTITETTELPESHFHGYLGGHLQREWIQELNLNIQILIILRKSTSHSKLCSVFILNLHIVDL